MFILIGGFLVEWEISDFVLRFMWCLICDSPHLFSLPLGMSNTVLLFPLSFILWLLAGQLSSVIDTKCFEIKPHYD